jgi:hypothetical protein
MRSQCSAATKVSVANGYAEPSRPDARLSMHGHARVMLVLAQVSGESDRAIKLPPDTSCTAREVWRCRRNPACGAQTFFEAHALVLEEVLHRV